MDLKKWMASDFLTAEDVKKDQLVEIVGEAKTVLKNFEGEEREALEIPVKLADGSKKIYSANRTSARNLAEKWGVETLVWVGHSIKFSVAKQRVRGTLRECIYGEPG